MFSEICIRHFGSIILSKSILTLKSDPATQETPLVTLLLKMSGNGIFLEFWVSYFEFGNFYFKSEFSDSKTPLVIVFSKSPSIVQFCKFWVRHFW